MSFNRIDNQQLLLWAAVAFAVYWIFFRNKQEFYNQPVHHHHVPTCHEQPPTLTEEDAHILGIQAPPSEDIPQYAAAYTM